MLWQHLVDKPVRTNARCSPHFAEALKTLNRLAVPVGWLFIHSKKSPGRGTGYSDNAEQFHSLSVFKEEVFLALRKIDGISIEGCAGLADIRRGLSNVFSRMAHGQSAIPGLQIIKVISGGRTF